ncbi:MAG: hypothetical protein ACE5KS_10270 [Woeseiaceae bacterium]
MAKAWKLIILKVTPVLFVTASAVAYVSHVEGPDAFALRNAMPMIIVAVLSAITLYRGNGSWIGAGWRWPLGTLGFAIPALGLSMYLHYGYSIDLDGMFSDAKHPEALFRFLPIYTAVAGGIGFAIGWIVGRNV